MHVPARSKTFFARLRSIPYPWKVVAILFFVLLVIIGVRVSFGIFFKSIESEFGLTRAATSAIFAAFMLMGGVFAIPGGRLADKYGPKTTVLFIGVATGSGLILVSLTRNFLQIFLIYGLLLSIGNGLLVPVVASTISRLFDKNRTLAIGIVQAGGALGGVVPPLFVAYLIAVENWRTTYVIYGLLSGGIILIFGLAFRSKRTGRIDGSSPSGDLTDAVEAEATESYTLAELLKIANFWKVLFSMICYGFFLFFLITHIVPYLTDLGFSEGKAALMVGLINGSAIAGRLAVGIAADRLNKKLVMVVCILMATVSMIWIIRAGSLTEFYLIALISGFSIGGYPPVSISLTVDLFGKQGLGSLFGVMELGTAIGAALGPVLGGILFDITHSYFAAFVCTTFVTLIAAVLIGSLKQKR